MKNFLFFALTLSIIGLNYSQFYNVGWIHHDEGIICYPSSMLLRGHRPHTQIQDLYTGGVAYLHALFMKTGDESMITVRNIFLIITLSFFACVFLFLKNFSKTVNAAVWTLAIAMWSFNSYFAAIPSWYILIFATLSLFCLVLWPSHTRAVFLAGFLIGCSFLAKISGLYFLVAACFWHLCRRFGPESNTAPNKLSTAYTSLKIAVIFCVTLIISNSGYSKFNFFENIIYLGPTLSIAAYSAFSQLRNRKISAAKQFNFDCRFFSPLFLGFLLPALIFLSSYPIADWGKVASSILNFRFRFEGSLRQPIQVSWIALFSICLTTYLYALMEALDIEKHKVIFYSTLVNITTLLSVIIFLKPTLIIAIDIVLGLALLPFTLIFSALIKHDRSSNTVHKGQNDQMLLCAFYAHFASLIQFPTFSFIYFLFHFLLSILATLFLSKKLLSTTSGVTTGLVVAALGGFIIGPSLRAHLVGGDTLSNTSTISSDRFGLKLSPAEADRYNQMLNFIKTNSQDSDYIFAGPSRPDIYFLANKLAPDGITFDNLPGWEINTSNISMLIDDYKIRVAVFSKLPRHREDYSYDFFQKIKEKLPNREENDEFIMFSH